ncbi:unnamed protein product [Diabrotica balteata]|uniref:Uncharacterized protein n=1 Tax=Diabrotica balteata TaxID=107213 RepID=A0A9N9XH69_DIABA|nr:unnamed protein product [Diabrotica balteata]
MNQAKKTEVNKIKADGNPLDMKLLDDICNGNDSSHNNYTGQYDWTMLRNFLIRVGNSCSDMLKACKWSSDKKSCEDLFNNDLTDEGLCCSFNRLPPTKIFRNPNYLPSLVQPININLIQIYAPTSDKPETEVLDFYRHKTSFRRRYCIRDADIA